MAWSLFGLPSDCHPALRIHFSHGATALASVNVVVKQKCACLLAYMFRLRGAPTSEHIISLKFSGPSSWWLLHGRVVPFPWGGRALSGRLGGTWGGDLGGGLGEHFGGAWGALWGHVGGTWGGQRWDRGESGRNGPFGRPGCRAVGGTNGAVGGELRVFVCGCGRGLGQVWEERLVRRVFASSHVYGVLNQRWRERALSCTCVDFVFLVAISAEGRH